MEGCQERAQTSSLHDGLTSRQLQMRGCVVLMDMNQYWDFPFHAAIKHYCILQRLQCLAGILFCQYICPHTTFPGSLIFSAQRFCTSTKDTCLDVSLTGTATTNSIYCCFSLFSGRPGHFMDWARALLRTQRLRLSVLWTTPAAGKPFYTLGSLIICGILHQINIIQR